MNSFKKITTIVRGRYRGSKTSTFERLVIICTRFITCSYLISLFPEPQVRAIVAISPTSLNTVYEHCRIPNTESLPTFIYKTWTCNMHMFLPHHFQNREISGVYARNDNKSTWLVRTNSYNEFVAILHPSPSIGSLLKEECDCFTTEDGRMRILQILKSGCSSLFSCYFDRAFKV